jgi:hypothetical protein
MDCSKSPLMHKHHIIPRYMGGADGEENLVEVTIAQHAMFHYCNYQLWSNMEDYVAWRGLSGQISEAEFIVERQKIFGKIGSDRLQEKLKNNPELEKEIRQKQIKSWNKNKEKNIEKIKIYQPLAVEAARTPEARRKQKEKLKEINHQQGESNSQYGKIWIYNLELKENKKIYKTKIIPKGWKEGRIIDFDNYIEKENIKITRKLQRELELNEKINHYTKLYEIYLTEGFQYIKKELNYDKTQENLIMKFKKYVSAYVPYACVRGA